MKKLWNENIAISCLRVVIAITNVIIILLNGFIFKNNVITNITDGVNIVILIECIFIMIMYFHNNRIYKKYERIIDEAISNNRKTARRK